MGVHCGQEPWSNAVLAAATAMLTSRASLLAIDAQARPENGSSVGM